MRGRPDDPDIWGDLYDRFRGPEAAARRRVRSSSLSPGASGRLYDAAIGVLQSIRTLVDVAEEVLEERRARIGEPGEPASPWVRTAPPDRDARTGLTDDGGVVRDIPFAGS